MGKQGHGIGKGKPKLKDRGFGNALIRQQPYIEAVNRGWCGSCSL